MKNTTEKQPAKTSKYDWKRACCFDAKICEKPRLLRLAYALMEYANGDTHIAFPTQETLCEQANIGSTRQLREALSDLAKAKAITRLRISHLTPEELDQNPGIKKRGKRGTVYRLNLFWAQEAIERHSYKWKHPDTDARNKIGSRLAKRTEPVRYERTEPVRYNEDWDSPANTSRETTRTLDGALDEEAHNGCVATIRTREAVDVPAQDTTERTPSENSSPEPKKTESDPPARTAIPNQPAKRGSGNSRVGFEAIDPPATPQEAAEYLSGRGVPPDRLAAAVQRLMRWDLTEYDIEGLIFDGRLEGAA